MPQPTEYLTSVSRYRQPAASAGPRALAALLSAMLVISALLPGAAFANEADSEGEGSVPAEEVAVHGEGPEFEPGGEETALEELPVIGAPGGDAEDAGEGAPVEAEPEEDLEVPPPPVDETATVPDDEEEGAGEEPALTEEPVEAITGESESASAPVYEAAPPSAAPVENQPLVAPPAPPLETEQAQSETSAVVASTESPTPLTPAEEQPPAPQPVANAEPTNSEGSLAGRDSHTVRSGESLWLIAEALLPEGAGNAAIAREVQRLWQLNESRIGTGDPDLLMVGTRLRLR